MDYLKAAREAHECAQEVHGSPLTEEYRREAETCAFIAIAGELRKLNEHLANASRALEADLGEMGYVPPV